MKEFVINMLTFVGISVKLFVNVIAKEFKLMFRKQKGDKDETIHRD